MSEEPASEPVRTPRLEQILQSAAQEATRRGHRHLGVEHLMLAILDEGHSVPAQLLARQIPLDEVRAPLDAFLRGEAYNSGR